MCTARPARQLTKSLRADPTGGVGGGEEQVASLNAEVAALREEARVGYEAQRLAACEKVEGGGGELVAKQEEVDTLKAQLEKVKTEARAYLEKQKKMHQEELARVVAEAGEGGAGREEALRGEVVALQEDLKKTKLQVCLSRCIY